MGFDVVQASEIGKTFAVKGASPVVALTEVSFNVPAGRLTALIGPDGAGKTTFLRMLCGLLPVDEGELTVLGLDVGTSAQSVQNRISYMPQRFGLYEDLSVRENLDLYADLHGVPQELRTERYDKLLAMTGLAPFTERYAGKLSGGMKQKLGLACTLVRSPELLLLDEPTVGVDPLSRRELWEILQRLVQEEALTVLVSTSYMEEAELCDKVVIIYAGRVLADTTPAELRRRMEGRCYGVIPPAGLPSRILQSGLLGEEARVVDAVPEGGAVRFTVCEGVDTAELLRGVFPGLRAAAVPSRLEDGFMELLREQKSVVRGDETAVAAPDLRKDYSLPEQVEIEVCALTRKFGDFTAVADSSFQVHQGEIFGLLGPNGAGKTTTFRMLCGLLPATSGSLSVAGVNLRTARTKAREKIGYVAQKFSLYANLTVRENLIFFGGVYGLSRAGLEQRVAEVSRQFGLSERLASIAGSLPGGFKQRLSMAAALLHEPQILFLDEPTSGIDPPARRIFWRRITALAALGTTIVITTHFMEEAEYCDRIMIQDQGTILAIGTPQEVRAAGGNDCKDMNAAFISIVEKARSGQGAAV